MFSIASLVITFAVANVLAYHDPDLNYHLSQVQKAQPCDTGAGYSYQPPAVQLTTAGVQPAPAFALQNSFLPAVSKPVNTYLPVAPKPVNAYLPVGGYQTSEYTSGATYGAPVQAYNGAVAQANYASQALTSQVQSQKTVHGYATTAGLSTAAAPGRITPLATYAQAPIIAKITAAPLIAKFGPAPSKTTFVSQTLGAQGYASQSLNSYSTSSGGPVVTQVYAAPSAQYAVSPALRFPVQQSRYTQTPAQVNHYSQTTAISALTPVAQVPGYKAAAQYATSTVHVSAPSAQYGAPAAQYGAPAVQYGAPAAQYGAPAVQYGPPAAQYGAPAVQYSAPAVQYSAPAVQYSAPAVQYSAPAVQYSAPAVQQYRAPVVAQYQAPVQQYAVPQYSAAAVQTAHYSGASSGAQYASVGHVAAAPAVQLGAQVAVAGHAAAPVKNVHTDFLENYDAHPRYAYEYRVNDPHTGDIKHQKEERDGEVVKGQYSLVEPDGSVRTVDYVADWETGFHANVRNSRDNRH